MEISLARDNIVHSHSSVQGLQRSLLIAGQQTSQDYSKDRAKVAPRGVTNSPDNPYKFNSLFGVGARIAEGQPYKDLEGLAKAANTWNQLKRNVQPQQERARFSSRISLSK